MLLCLILILSLKLCFNLWYLLCINYVSPRSWLTSFLFIAAGLSLSLIGLSIITALLLCVSHVFKKGLFVWWSSMIGYLIGKIVLFIWSYSCIIRKVQLNSLSTDLSYCLLDISNDAALLLIYGYTYLLASKSLLLLVIHWLYTCFNSALVWLLVCYSIFQRFILIIELTSSFTFSFIHLQCTYYKVYYSSFIFIICIDTCPKLILY